MKKNYISPALKVRELHLHHMICASNQVMFGSSNANNESSSTGSGEGGFNEGKGTSFIGFDE